MRCGCPECGVYMIQSEGINFGCVCPECLFRCRMCMGTNTVVSREALRSLAFDPRFQPGALAETFRRQEDDDGWDD